MKHLLFYIAVFCSLPFWLSSCGKRSNTPDIIVHTGEVSFNGEKRVISYTFLFRSKDGLKSLEVKPNIVGENKDSNINYQFEDGAHYAALEYFYVIPDNFVESSITFTLKLNGLFNSTEKTETVQIDDELIWALDKFDRHY